MTPLEMATAEGHTEVAMYLTHLVSYLTYCYFVLYAHLYSLFVTQLFTHTFTFSFTLPIPDALMYDVCIFVKWNEPFCQYEKY